MSEPAAVETDETEQGQSQTPDEQRAPQVVRLAILHPFLKSNNGQSIERRNVKGVVPDTLHEPDSIVSPGE